MILFRIFSLIFCLNEHLSKVANIFSFISLPINRFDQMCCVTAMGCLLTSLYLLVNRFFICILPLSFVKVKYRTIKIVIDPSTTRINILVVLGSISTNLIDSTLSRFFLRHLVLSLNKSKLCYPLSIYCVVQLHHYNKFLIHFTF